ncbi:MAG: hypothetical protein OEW75_14320, partial [Cyclobacteriaceae bacterium]|nr:hypothetical protein [Cyclobacteriaceae bacterium]
SFTMGWGVEQDSSFSEILQRVSSKKVANLGISSFGTARELMALNQVKLDSVKTIIIQYHPNDLQENKSFIINDQLKISGKSVYDSLIDAQMHSRYYYPGKYISLILKERLKEYIGKPLEETDREEAELFVKVTEVFADKLLGKEIIIFEINRANENDSFFSNHLKSQFDKYWGENPEFKLKILDVSNMVSDSDYFILDDHLNSEGHKKLAKLLIEHINK